MASHTPQYPGGKAGIPASTWFDGEQLGSTQITDVSSLWNSSWAPPGQCSPLPLRKTTSRAQSSKDRFIPRRVDLDGNMSNYLLEVRFILIYRFRCFGTHTMIVIISQAASEEHQDAESSPSKQDYMNTLKEGVLQATEDTKVIIRPKRDCQQYVVDPPLIIGGVGRFFRSTAMSGRKVGIHPRQ